MTGVEHVYSVSRPGMAVLTVQFKVGVPRIEALVRLLRHDQLEPRLGVAQARRPRAGHQAEGHRRRAGGDAHALERRSRARRLRARARGARRRGGAEARARHARGADARRPGARGARAARRRPHERARRLGARRAQRPAALQRRRSRPASSCATTARSWSRPATTSSRPPTCAPSWSARSERRPVFLSDVAEVVDGPDQPSRYVWTGPGPAGERKGIRAAGEHPAVTLQVTKKPGENAVDVAERVIAARRRAARHGHPGRRARHGHAQLRRHGERQGATAHQEAHLRHAARSSCWSSFALGRREALIVGVAVLLTLATTLFASWAWGFTLNRVSLFALIFSIGILVDDAIVVVENIHRRMSLESRPLTEHRSRSPWTRSAAPRSSPPSP